MNKREEALNLAEELLSNIELEKISVKSSLLSTIRIARLMDDLESLTWLLYEQGGYPRTKDGKHIDSKAFEIACKHGRSYFKDDKKYIFSELTGELESSIEASKKAITNYSTAGVSTSGDYGFHAMNSLTNSVSQGTNSMLENIKNCEKRLSILKGEYYNFILRTYVDLKFSNQVGNIFESYKNKVGLHLIELAPNSQLKLSSIEEDINSDNTEKHSQILTTCRRLFNEISDKLFEKYFEGFENEKYITISGKELDITGDKYLNRLSAVIEKLQQKSCKKSLIGSQIVFLIDWIENINSLQCKGVHAEISKEEARKCVIHTYICIGDIISFINSIE